MLPRVATPTLVLHGTQDKIVPYSHARKLVDAVPGARLVTFEGGGHALQGRDAVKVNRLIRDFVLDRAVETQTIPATTARTAPPPRTRRSTQRRILWLSSPIGLGHIQRVAMPDNNWNFFPVMAALGLARIGGRIDSDAQERCLAQIERLYLRDGWYGDGSGGYIDHYNGFALHFYGLIYARHAAANDPARAKRYVDRATAFADGFRHWFAADGAALAIGRSLTYRFAMAGFWAARGAIIVPPSMSCGVSHVPTSPPQVRFPTRGPSLRRWNMYGIRSPPDPAISFTIMTLGPQMPAAGEVNGFLSPSRLLKYPSKSRCSTSMM